MGSARPGTALWLIGEGPSTALGPMGVGGSYWPSARETGATPEHLGVGWGGLPLGRGSLSEMAQRWVHPSKNRTRKEGQAQQDRARVHQEDGAYMEEGRGTAD